MELIEIISKILIFGSSLLALVTLISFVLSKTRREEKPNNYHHSPQITTPLISQPSVVSSEQKTFRKNQTVSYPQIFQLDNTIPKEIKVVRKPTVAKRDIQEEMRFDTKYLSKTNGNGTRYRIVNEEMKKSGIKAANFYL